MLMQKAYQFLLGEDICPSTFNHGSSNGLDICPVAFMYLMVELGKVRNILGVGLQDICRLQDLDAVLVDDRYLVLEEERVDALILVVRPDGDEQEAEGLHLLCFERPKEMEPTEGEEFAITLAKRVRDIRHSESDAHDLFLLIDHEGDKIEVEDREIHILIVVLLRDGHGLKVIELLVRLVDDIHVLDPEPADEFAGVLDFHHVHVRAFLNYIRDAHESLGTSLWRIDLKLYPVCLFDQAVGFYMADVVRVVIERSHDSGVFVSLKEQALMVKIRKADRSVEAVHATLFAPSRYGVEERFGDLEVIDEIEPSETHVLESPFLVRATVDDAGDASDGFVISVRHPELVVADLQSGVHLRIETIHLIEEERRAVIRAVPVQVVSELNEFFQFTFRTYFPYFQSHFQLIPQKNRAKVQKNFDICKFYCNFAADLAFRSAEKGAIWF